jgi:hypothetical protein
VFAFCCNPATFLVRDIVFHGQFLAHANAVPLAATSSSPWQTCQQQQQRQEVVVEEEGDGGGGEEEVMSSASPVSRDFPPLSF